MLEFSARGAGHIAALAAAVPPRIGVVLNVGSAHLGEFGSVEAIARAKGELVEALPADGVAVLNADDPRVAAMAARTVRRGASRSARTPTCAPKTSPSTPVAPGSAWSRPTGSAPVALRLVGAHHVGNALAAAAVAGELGGAPEAVAAALSAAAPASRWRMEVTDRADGVTVVNDAYNANPDSMAAALRALAALGGRQAHLGRARADAGAGRRESATAHEGVARLAKELGVDELVTVDSPEYGAGRPVADVAQATALLPGRAGAGRRRAREGLTRRRARPGRRRPPGGRRMRGIFIAAGVALAISILLTPYLIRFFARQGFGQEIRAEGPQSHQAKRGTPTMGGVAIMIAIWLGYLLSHMVTGEQISPSAMLVLFLTTALGVVGFLDDFIKLRRARNLGLNKTSKIVGQVLTATVFGILALRFGNADGLTPGSDSLSFVRDIAVLSFGLVGFVLLANLIIAAWSNAVNLTDGLDGLAAGTAAMVLGTYVIICFWQFRNNCALASAAGCYQVRDPLDVGVLAAAAMGACIGFLWWNAAPARIFMGDTGSLALGGLVAGLSIVTRTELLLVVIGGVFVVEALSVAMQILVFRTTRRRVFRMAPFHHHFELAGWAETTVIIRFWLLAAMCAALGLGLFYSEWLTASAGG